MDQYLQWVADNEGALLGVTLLVFFVLYTLIVFRPKKIQTGDAGMINRAEWEQSHRSKRLRERQHVIDMFEDGLLKLLTDRKIDTASYQNWHHRFAVLLSLEEMLPNRVVDLKQIKETMRKRRNSGTYYGVYKPVNIPGPKPGENVTLEQEEQQARDELHALLISLR